MVSIERIKQFVTGKTAIERKQEATAKAVIRQRVRTATLKEREAQQIKVAQERERIIAQRQIERLKKPAIQSYFNYGSPFGQPRFSSSEKPKYKIVKKRILVKPKKKQKYRIVKRKVMVSQPSVNQQPQKRYDIISGAY